jgi:hypothetical protein
MLTWYGTIVRTDRHSGMRIHAPLWPARERSEDLELNLPPERLEGQSVLPGDPPIVVQAAPTGRGVRLMQGSLYLSTRLAAGEVAFTAEAPRRSEIFMPFTGPEIERLRDIVRHGWRIVETGDVVGPGAAWMNDAFILHIGRERVLLERDMPVLDITGQILTFVDIHGRTMHARRGDPLPDRDELLMTRHSPPPPQVQDAAAFAQAPEATLAIAGGTEFGYLPLTARIADQAWMYARTTRAGSPTLGPYETGTRIIRQRDKFVLLTEGQEGVVFDETGVCNEGGYLFNRTVVARGALMREGNNVLIDRAVLQSAPRLEGSIAVFCNGNLSNYYHWVIDALLPLFIMRPFLAAGTRLLIPWRIAALRDKPGIIDHMAALRAWGFADLPTVEPNALVCRAEEVVWLDHLLTINVLAHTLLAARAHVWSLTGAPGAARRIYIRRQASRGVLNDAEVEAFLATHGFETHAMEPLSAQDQIDMFRDATYVVGVHGAALSNIIYCAPGTRVLELSPVSEYRSNYAELSDKLGLVHAVLPCPTDNDEFHGGMRLVVDVAALGRLLTQLQNWH